MVIQFRRSSEVHQPGPGTPSYFFILLLRIARKIHNLLFRQIYSRAAVLRSTRKIRTFTRNSIWSRIRIRTTCTDNKHSKGQYHLKYHWAGKTRMLKFTSSVASNEFKHPLSFCPNDTIKKTKHKSTGSHTIGIADLKIRIMLIILLYNFATILLS